MSGNIYLGATEYSVGEREGFVTITIKRDGDTSKAVSVSYATNPDGATPGLDYTASSGKAMIAAGASSTTIRIPILNDALSEATESFNVSLINVDSGTLLFPRTTIVSILDDENPVVEPVNPPLVSDYSVKTVDAVTGLNGPMQIEWIEGSNIALVSEKEGRIKLVDFTTGKVVSTLLDIAGKVNSDADRGLLDIALHPDLKNNPYLYAYYVADPADVKASGAASADNLGNRYAHLVRYELDMSGPIPTIKPGSETVMLGGAGKSLSDISGAGALDYTDPIHSGQRSSDMNTDGTYKQDYIKVDSRSHAGGAIAFGPDGALYVSTGDGTSYNYADPRTASVQNINSLSGKVLRIDPITGDGFADNPYATSNLDANASKVWQMGLRNPYAMTFTDDGRIMISETGWYSWEEINSGGKGANFGWPYYEGADNGEVNKTPGYQTMPGASLFYTNVANGTIVVTPAFRAFSHEARDPGHDMQAIVGGTTVYDGNKYPDIFKGDYFFSDIVDGDIFTVDVNDRTQLQFVTNIGTYHAVSFVQGPDGYVYYSDITGNKIVRLEITDPNAVPNRAPVVANPIADTTGTAGTALSITLPANVFTDADGDQLSLSATLASGQALPAWMSFNPITRAFTGTPPAGQTGPIEIRLTATDPDGAAVNDVFKLTIGGTATNNAPVVAAAIADQSVTEGVNWNYKLPVTTFSDADNDTLTLVATQANGQGLPGWISFNAQTGSFSGIPPAGTSGSFTFRVTATDTKGAKVSDDFVLTIGTAPEVLVQDTTQNQFVSGNSVNDVFVYAGASSLYQWGLAEDGKSTVVWTRASNDDKFDVLTGFEKLRFTDKTVVLADLNQQGPDYRDIADTIQELTGKTAADRFIVNGKSSDYAWGNTADGKSLVIWTVSSTDDTYDVLTSFDQIVFADKTVYLTGTPPANSAPVVARAIADQTVTHRGEYSFAIPAETFTDANGDTLTYSAKLASGAALPAWLKLDPATGLFSGMTPAEAGKFSIVVTASDGKGGTASDTFELTLGGNTAPVLVAPLRDWSLPPGYSFAFSVPDATFSDADGDKLTYSATLVDGSPLPSWITYDSVLNKFSGQPNASATNVSVKVTASDGRGGTASDVFVIGTGPVNDAPVLSKPIADYSLSHNGAGMIFMFDLPSGTFTDANGDKLTYTATQADGSALPTWLSFDPATGTFRGQPPEFDSVSIKVTASDGKGGVVSDVFDIAMKANNPPVVANPVADQSFKPGDSFLINLGGTFADPDNDGLLFFLTLADGSPLPSWITASNNGRLLTGTVPADAGSISIKVSASDRNGGGASDVFEVKVTTDNHAPVVTAPIADKIVAEESVFSFILPANTFTDADKDALSIVATQANGSALPNWLKFDVATQTFSGRPDDADVGKLAIAVTAKDGHGGEVTDTFDLTVTPVNDAPVLSKPIADATATVGSAYSFGLPAGTFTDVDNPTLSYSATLADGKALPTWLSFNAATGVFSGSPGDTLVGSLTIKVTAKDAGGLTASDEFKLTIGAKPAAETLYQNTAANQNIDAGDGKDVFVLGGNSSGYSWGPTQDGKGVVIWNDKGFDVLFNFEELRFTNKTVTVASVLGDGSSDFIDDVATTQYITGTSSADRFIIDGNAADYGWGRTQDGKGVVVWDQSGENPHDILTSFEKLVFDDREADISGLGQV